MNSPSYSMEPAVRVPVRHVLDAAPTDLVGACYRAQGSLPDLLRSVLELLEQVFSCSNASIALHAAAWMDEHDRVISAPPRHNAPAAISPRAHGITAPAPLVELKVVTSSYRTFAIRYHRDVLGELSVRFAHPPTLMVEEQLADLAADIGLLVRRYEVGVRSMSAIGARHMFIGWSAALREMERHISRLAAGRATVMIVGDAGTELPLAAYALHVAGGRAAAPFVEVVDDGGSAESFRARLSSAIDRAAGGTLVISGIDSLPVSRMRAVFAWALSPPSLFAGADAVSCSSRPRIVLTSHTPLEWLAESRRGIRPSLAAAIELPRLVVPPLAARLADIPHIAEHRRRELGAPPESLSAVVSHVLMSFEWPGNRTQLDRTLTRLLRSGFEHSPLPAPVPAEVNPPPPLLEHAATTLDAIDISPAAEAPPAAKAPGNLTRQILDGSLDSSLHPCLARALMFIRANYHHEIDSVQIARAACASPSHLAHLFKKVLGVSFRLLLAEVRIERAKDLLAQDPHRRITEISLDVGFGDLSHFVKSFKRFVGVSPREYRRRLPMPARNAFEQPP